MRKFKNKRSDMGSFLYAEAKITDAEVSTFTKGYFDSPISTDGYKCLQR